MTAWVKGAEKSVMIDGCLLKCQGRVLKKLVGEDKVIHIQNALEPGGSGLRF